VTISAVKIQFWIYAPLYLQYLLRVTISLHNYSKILLTKIKLQHHLEFDICTCSEYINDIIQFFELQSVLWSPMAKLFECHPSLNRPKFSNFAPEWVQMDIISPVVTILQPR